MITVRQETTTRGFTLIELLLTLALGAFVVALSIALYQHAKRAYIESSAQLLITERLLVSQRTIKEALTGSLSSCSTAPQQLSLVNGSQFWSQAGHSTAVVYAPHNLVDGLKKIGTQNGERDALSDVLLLRPAVMPATAVVAHDIENNKLITHNSIGLTRGGLAIVCDQNAAVIFQVAYTTGRHIHYSGSGIEPGNCSEAFISDQCGTDYRFGAGALLAHYKPLVFYIANGYAGAALYRQKPTIFRQDHSRRLALRAQELVSGVTRLHVGISHTDTGQGSGLVLHLRIAGEVHANPNYDESYLYTLSL